jgi:hypothetical protein
LGTSSPAKGVAAFALGLVALVLPIIIYVRATGSSGISSEVALVLAGGWLVAAVLAIVLGALARNDGRGRGFAIAGLILGILDIVLGLMMLFATITSGLR